MVRNLRFAGACRAVARELRADGVLARFLDSPKDGLATFRPFIGVAERARGLAPGVAGMVAPSPYRQESAAGGRTPVT